MTITTHNTETPNCEHVPEHFGTFMRRMLNVKDIFRKRMEKVDFVRSLRNTKHDVLNGSKTLSDLLSTDLHLNHSYTAEEIKYIFEHSTEAQREQAFPRRRLCDYMEMTEQQYKEVDVDNNRRDTFFLLQKLFRNAQRDYPMKDRKIPHVLLIEELSTTLNTQCIGKFLYDTALAVVENEADASKMTSWLKYEVHPDKKRLFVLCTDPNTTTVRAEYSLHPHPLTDLGMKVRIAYDVTVSEDRFISYQNIHAMIVFPRTCEKAPSQEIEITRKWEIANIRKKVFDGHSSLTQYPDPEMEKFVLDYDLQRSGFAMDARLVEKTFTARSMLATIPQEVELPEHLKLRAKNRANKRVAACITREKTKNIWSIMRKFLTSVLNGLCRFFSYIKNLLLGYTTSETKITFATDEQKPEGKTHTASTSGEIAIIGAIKHSDLAEQPKAAQHAATENTKPKSTTVTPSVQPAAVFRRRCLQQL